MQRYNRLLAMLATSLLLGASGTVAQDQVELRFFCTSDTGGCDVWNELLTRFTEANPTIHVTVDHLPYKAELETLPVQLAAGEGPDIAAVTDLAGLKRFYLDLTPYVDAARFEADYAPSLQWLRGDDQGKEIYGFGSSLTVGGGYINKTLFEQAEVAIPAEGATWEDWAAATREVAEKTETPYAMSMDRSGHRFAAIATSYGAQLFGEDGRPVVDDGLRKAATLFVQWHKDGIMPKELWGDIGGTTYAEFFDQFRNGQTVFNFAGSWALGRMNEIGELFEWQAVPSPCGDVACSVMPGGGAIVAINTTKHPEEVAKVIAYMAEPEVIGEVLARTAEIPQNATLVKTGIQYQNLDAAQAAGLELFTAQIPKIAPAAYRLQGSSYMIAYINAFAARLSQAINGELTVGEALERVVGDVNLAIDSAGK